MAENPVRVLSSCIRQHRITVADLHQLRSDIVGVAAPALAGQAFAQRLGDRMRQGLAGEPRELSRQLISFVVLDVGIAHAGLR
jgi:hypothetical protein